MRREMKYILIGIGDMGKDALINIGRENIAFVYDNFYKGDEWESVKVITYEQLKLWGNDYCVLVTPGERFARFELCNMLRKNGISYDIYQKDFSLPIATAHIFGKFPAIRYQFNCVTGYAEKKWLFQRADRMKIMLQAVFETYSEEYCGKEVDLWCSMEDHPTLAYQVAVQEGLKHIFCYCTSRGLEDIVIPMPDYNSYISYKDECLGLQYEECIKIGENAYMDDRAFWVGTLENNIIRKELYYYAKLFSNFLRIENKSYYVNEEGKDGSHRFIKPIEFGTYKYLIDLPGFTYSDRTKLLMQLQRPVLMFDRPYKEWYWDELIPMEHYVPIRADLSDLLDKITFLNNNPLKYNEIVKNARKFSESHFKPEVTLKVFHDLIMKYGLKS